MFHWGTEERVGPIQKSEQQGRGVSGGVRRAYPAPATLPEYAALRRYWHLLGAVLYHLTNGCNEELSGALFYNIAGRTGCQYTFNKPFIFVT